MSSGLIQARFLEHVTHLVYASFRAKTAYSNGKLRKIGTCLVHEPICTRVLTSLPTPSTAYMSRRRVVDEDSFRFFQPSLH